jgi:hypothetical protein
MNLAKILIDPHQDPGVVAVADFAPERSEKTTKEVQQMLFCVKAFLSFICNASSVVGLGRR